MEENKKEELTTQVTNVAQELEKQNVQIPSGEELVSKVASAYISNKQLVSQLFRKLSSKEKNRVFDAILDLPMEDMVVALKSKEEMETFQVGQNVQIYRFLLLQDKAKKDIMRAKQEMEQKNKSKEELVEDFKKTLKSE